MEPRQMLSVAVPALNVGATYYQPHDGTDTLGSLLYFSWNGGAPGTQLTEIILDTHKDPTVPQDANNDPVEGDAFFHIAPSDLGGTMDGVAPSAVEETNVGSVTFNVQNDSTLMTIDCTDFQQSGRLVVDVNLDELESWSGGVAKRVVEGADFDGTHFTAVFSAPDYQTTTVVGTFRNVYADLSAEYGLNLPNDDYMPPSTTPEPVFTAGVGDSVQQTPLPITLSGTVFDDLNMDNHQETGEPGIGDVSLTLYELNGTGGYDATGMTTTTDANGDYQFTGLLPGTYRVAETQPAGYLSVGATAGTVDGATRGVVTTVDILSSINLDGGDNSIQNDFAEVVPAGISGKVYADLNDNNTFDAGDKLLPGVTIYLLDGSGNRITSTTTDANGKYAFTDLMPGTYGVEEIQPAGYLEGSDAVGTAGGVVNGPDQILSAPLASGVNGLNYDFWEVVPATISGYVFQDGPPIVVKQGDPPPYIPAIRTGILTPDDVRLSGVVLELCDGSGVPLLDSHGNKITAVTDANGYYAFNMLYPGEYSVVEVPPAQYLTGIDRAGSDGGTVVNPYSIVPNSVLGTLAVSASGNAIVEIPINPGDVAVQYNFSHVLVTTKPNPPPSPPPIIPPVVPPAPPTPPLTPPTQIPFTYQSTDQPYVMIVSAPAMAFGGGSGDPGDYTWHLSVIDAGYPRGESTGDDFVQSPDNSYFDPVSWHGPDLGQSQWILADQDGVPVKTLRFGITGATPVTGDWDGSGTTKIGVFLDGLWFLDLNGNGIWDKSDLWIKLGKRGDQPVAGDWNGDGKTDIGIFGSAWVGDARAVARDPGLPASLNPPKNRPKNVPPKPADAALGWRTLQRGAAGRLRSDLIDHVFQFGRKGDIAVVGDWSGDGIYTIGIFRDGVWFLDMDGDGRWSEGDLVVNYGQPGDLPVVGDWTGDGITKLGVYRNGTFYLDTNNNHVLDAGDKVIELGHPGDKPVSGDWDGDGVDKVGVYEDGVAPEPST